MFLLFMFNHVLQFKDFGEIQFIHLAIFDNVFIRLIGYIFLGGLYVYIKGFTLVYEEGRRANRNRNSSSREEEQTGTAPLEKKSKQEQLL